MFGGGRGRGGEGFQWRRRKRWPDNDTLSPPPYTNTLEMEMDRLATWETGCWQQFIFFAKFQARSLSFFEEHENIFHLLFPLFVNIFLDFIILSSSSSASSNKFLPSSSIPLGPIPKSRGRRGMGGRPCQIKYRTSSSLSLPPSLTHSGFYMYI